MAAQVRAMLHGPNATFAFRYELLDNTNKLKKRLGNILGASVYYTALADIKRTAKFEMEQDVDINFLTDRIKPYVRLKMSDGNWIEWPQGVFLLTSPTKKTDSAGVIRREVEAYDQLQVLIDDKLDTRYTVAAGTNYITAVKTVLTGAGIIHQNLTLTSKTLPAARDWAPGTAKLQIINDLLGAINYGSLWFDENGYAIAQPYVSPSIRASEYTYRDDDESVIFPEVEQSLDLWAVPNKWVLVVSELEREPMVSTYTNSNTSSPTSTVSRGRTITDYREYQEAVDQATLDARAQRIAFEASQVYEHVTLETGLMPFHSHTDVFTLVFSGLGISAKYSETSWEFEMRPGARHKHNIRRVVSI